MSSGSNIEGRIQRLVDTAFKSRLKNYTIEISKGSQGGDNWLGFMYKVKIEGKGESGEKVQLHLFTKLAPYQPLFRKLLNIRGIYDREIYTYNSIISEYLKLQKEKCLENMFNPFAKCYSSTLEESQEALLMEDMKMKGFRQFDGYQSGVDYHHASFVMKSLGKLHALSYAIQDQKPDVFDKWKSSCVESFFNSALFEPVISMITNLSEAILKTYEEAEEETDRDTFQRSIKNIPTIFKGLLDIDKFGKHVIISYGDFQIRNFLFKYMDSSKPYAPTDICMLDFQCLKLGSPAADISYFMSTCTEKQLRERYYNQLIQEYYQSLSSFLSQLGSDPDVLFPYETLLDHLKKFTVFGMFVGIWLVALDQKPNDNLPDLYNTDDEGTIVQHLSVIPNDDYTKRMRELISDYIKYGYDL